MNRDLAYLVATEAMRAGAPLADLVPVLKQHLPEAEYIDWQRAVAHCISQVGQHVLERVFAEHPDLRVRFDEHIKNYGRAF